MRRIVPRKLRFASIYIYILGCGPAARCSSALMSKRKIRYSLCPDHCRAIVPCEIVPGQITTVASRNLPFLTLLFTFS